MSDFRYKQVIVFRSDLKLSKGKAVAQGGHAAISAAQEAQRHHKLWFESWLKEGQCKIAVKAKNEAQMQELENKAEKMELPRALIVDKGLTEIPPGTVTCLGIGPAPVRKIDSIPGTLPLL